MIDGDGNDTCEQSWGELKWGTQTRALERDYKGDRAGENMNKMDWNKNMGEVSLVGQRQTQRIENSAVDDLNASIADK